jgi:hypothetical protein
VFLIDSCPVPACDNIRIPYASAATENVFQGYRSSKRQWFYGLKVHLIATAEGYPVEASLTPGSAGKTPTQLRDRPPERLVALRGQSVQ